MEYFFEKWYRNSIRKPFNDATVGQNLGHVPNRKQKHNPNFHSGCL